jgi:ABC-type nitrate/sulfonate/bicarbonate transport system substrate-binding protein
LDDATHGPNARLFAPVYDAIGDHFMISAYFTTEAFANSHPDLVCKFADVILAADAWANRNRPLSAKMLEKYAGVPVPADATRVTYAEHMRVADVHPVLAILQQYKLVRDGIHPFDLFATEVPAAP